VQECILHIKLMNWLGARDGQGEHGVDHGRLDHWAEGLIVVDAGSLGEVTKDLASLVPLQRNIEVCMKIHLLVTMLEPTGRGTRSQVLLKIKTTNSSSMVQHQF
jgi:hypothetical protein